MPRAWGIILEEGSPKADGPFSAACSKPYSVNASGEPSRLPGREEGGSTTYKKVTSRWLVPSPKNVQQAWAGLE